MARMCMNTTRSLHASQTSILQYFKEHLRVGYNHLVAALCYLSLLHIADLPNVTKELTFTCDAKHGLNSLTAEALKHLPRLEHIVLRGCPIESIDEDAFRGMTNLESVTIGVPSEMRHCCIL